MKIPWKSLLYILLSAAVSIALLFGMEAVSDVVTEKQQTAKVKAVFGEMLEADRYDEIETGAFASIQSAYKAYLSSGTMEGYAVTVVVKGYGGDMQVHVAVSPDTRTFIGLRVGENRETENLGAKVALPAFTDQFDGLPAPAYLDGYTGLEKTATDDNAIEAVGGATVSSKAVVKAANIAYSFIQDLGKGV